MSLKGFIYTPDCTILHHFFKIFSGEAPRTPTNGRGHPSRTLPTRPFGPRENPPRLSSGSATAKGGQGVCIPPYPPGPYLPPRSGVNFFLFPSPDIFSSFFSFSPLPSPAPHLHPSYLLTLSECPPLIYVLTPHYRVC